jgi:hypothetical protein
MIQGYEEVQYSLFLISDAGLRSMIQKINSFFFGILKNFKF